MHVSDGGNARSRLSVWSVPVRKAAVETITGFIIGLSTAFILVVFAVRIYPPMEESGQDLGLRFSVYLSRLSHFLSGAPVHIGHSAHSFVFVDVDPEFGLDDPRYEKPADSSVQPCAALAVAKPDLYRLADSAARPAPGRKPQKVQLACASLRPLNRYMLAELIQQLAAWEPRVIVLDVILREEPNVIPREEDQKLRDALAGRSGKAAGIPILWAEPVKLSGRSGDPDLDVQSDGQRVLEPDARLHTHATIALPAPGQPLRRYPKCLFNKDEVKSSASMPYLAAMLANDPLLAVPPCTRAQAMHENNAPRIIYTLPTSPSHEDQASTSTTRFSRAEAGHYWAVYKRCLAASFWSPAASCAQAAMYKDKIVVIGVSNPTRRDWHYTPLGDMTGAEVVINAIRSFLAYPENEDHGFSAILWKEIRIVFCCSLVWYLYFLVRARIGPLKSSAPGRRLAGYAMRTVGLVMTQAVVLALAFRLSYDPEAPIPSVNFLIPAIAIAIDIYVEMAKNGIDRMEGRLCSWFKLSDKDCHS